MENIVVETSTKKDIVAITNEAQKKAQKIQDGVIVLNILHTTAALTTADLDPGTDQDFLDFLEGIVPNVNWRHPHNPSHAPAHLLSSLIGSSLTVPVSRGSLQLGQWQEIVVVELDGSRARNIACSLLSGQ